MEILQFFFAVYTSAVYLFFSSAIRCALYCVRIRIMAMVFGV